MLTTTPDDAAYREARDRVRGAQRALDQHLNRLRGGDLAMLFLINLASSPKWWVQWPAMGWGLLSVLHGVFTSTGLLGLMEVHCGADAPEGRGSLV